MRMKIQNLIRDLGKGPGGAYWQIQRGEIERYEDYCTEHKGMVQGLDRAIDFVEQAKGKQDNQAPPPRSSPHPKRPVNGRAPEGENPAGVKAIPPPPMLTVTAHLVQTPQGPRIVLQDTQGIRLGHPQLDTVLYQVKQRQALACQQGKAPPNKITIQLARDVGKKTEVTASQSEEPAPNPQQQPQMAEEIARGARKGGTG